MELGLAWTPQLRHQLHPPGNSEITSSGGDSLWLTQADLGYASEHITGPLPFLADPCSAPGQC